VASPFSPESLLHGTDRIWEGVTSRFCCPFFHKRKLGVKEMRMDSAMKAFGASGSNAVYNCFSAMAQIRSTKVVTLLPPSFRPFMVFKVSQVILTV
jgi:hypothetical protein